MSRRPVLEIEGLSLSIDSPQAPPKAVLRGVELVLHEGQTLGLVGESGGGKTMVSKAVLDILPEGARITSGRMRFGGEDLRALSAKQRRGLLGRSMSMILQNPMTALNPVLRIADQMTDILRLHLGMGRRAALARAAQMLEAVRINEPERVLQLYPHEISGGMCQRVVISIAFACEPRLIVADEPTTALDVTIQHQILRLIKDMQARIGTAVLFVTHDLGVVAKVCDHVSVIHAGRILESGPVEDVFRDPVHPYTRALFDAAPRYDIPNRALKAMPQALSMRLLQEAADYDRKHCHV
jgi:peptide/nickel transport system ATP-binding protein